MDQPSAPPRAPTQAQFHAAINSGSGHWLAACVGITRDQTLAQDCVQDALTTAWARRDQYRGDAALTTWIHRIAVNTALQALRKQGRRSWALLDDDLVDHTTTPDEAYVFDQFGDALQAALRELSDLERVCFVLKHLEQWRLKEIAEHLELGIGQVKQALFRALKKLRASMGAPGKHND